MRFEVLNVEIYISRTTKDFKPEVVTLLEFKYGRQTGSTRYLGNLVSFRCNANGRAVALAKISQRTFHRH
jgi:hypothetical protein